MVYYLAAIFTLQPCKYDGTLAHVRAWGARRKKLEGSGVYKLDDFSGVKTEQS